MVEKAKEIPSYTKPMTSGDDARKVHPCGEKADYAKYTKELPFQGPSKGGYHNVGKKGKQSGADERKRPQGDKANYETGYTKDQGQKKGYDGVGKCSKQGCEDTRKEAPKPKSPWRK